MKKILAIVGATSVALGAVYLSNSEQPTIMESETVETATQAPEANTTLGKLVQITDSLDRDQKIKDFFAALLPNSIDDALAEIESLRNTSNRELCLSLLITVWHEKDSEGLDQWLSEVATLPGLDNALALLVDSEKTTLGSKLYFAELISTEQLRHSKLEALIEQWAIEATEEMVLWAAHKATEHSLWLPKVFEVLTKDSMTTAISAVPYLDGSEISTLRLAIQTIINSYEVGDADTDTLLALQSLSPYEIREELIGALLPLLAYEEAFTLEDMDALLGSVFDGEVKDAYYQQLARSWAMRNPDEAAAYALALEGEARPLAVDGVVTSWIQTDLEAADEWLKTVDGNVDMAANTIGRGSAQLGNIEIADTWINVIEDEEMRTSAIVDVIQGWYEASPEAGIYHLVYQKSLSNQEKLNILHEIYPNEVFLSPMEALDEIGRLEGLSSAY